MSYLLSFSPFDFGKHFAFGLGVGLGIGVLIRRINHEKIKQCNHLISCLKHLTAEVRQLRETLLQTVLKSNSGKALLEGDISSEDEFFDTEKGEDSSEEDLKEFLAKIDKLQDGSTPDQQDAYNILINKTNQFPNNCELLWRFAKAQYQISCLKEEAGDKDAQKFMNQKGIETAKLALQADVKNFGAHQWYAILVGNHIQFLETKEKIESGYIYKEHIEKAIELNPENATLHFLLGRYCFEVYMLPWYMRKAASVLFANPPTATVDDALKYFLKAEELSPGFWTANQMFIGKCYYEKRDYSSAKIWFRKATQVKVTTKEDEKSKNEALDFLKRC